ncbi:MAG TPA: hypothetical protein PKD83_06600 [Ignavibacteria bacterium]|nr:hypothetical protein [Ignavibacteria bacterium]
METGTLILIISLSVPLLVIVIIFYFMKRSFKKQSKFADELRLKISQARSATAVVLSASQGLTGGDINRIIHLRLEVSDGFGPTYITNATWFINTLHFDKIREGNAIMVKVNAQNKNIIYPAESWGKYTEGYENL